MPVSVVRIRPSAPFFDFPTWKRPRMGPFLLFLPTICRPNSQMPTALDGIGPQRTRFRGLRAYPNNWLKLVGPAIADHPGLSLDWRHDQSERPQATPSQAGRPCYQDQSHHRRFPDLRRTLGSAGASDTGACEYSSVRRRSAPGSRPHRTCANGIFYVLRTGCQWKALDATGICSGSTAHLRFQEWVAAGVFLELWRVGLERYDELKGLDWSWLSMDGAMTKAPLGGGKNRRQPHRPR